ncbi:hypothetical protein WCWAEYFT_CDS0115 [Vibrio phage VB_VaC_TDDLMA]
MIQLYFLKDKLSNIHWHYLAMNPNNHGGSNHYNHYMSDDLGDLIERIHTNRFLTTTNVTFPVSAYNLIEEFESFEELIQFLHDNYPEEFI